ncbi:hypothetical protein AB1L07_02360 [Niallia alba]
MNNTEKLTKLENFIDELSEMPMVKGVGTLENLYNKVILKANEVKKEVER